MNRETMAHFLQCPHPDRIAVWTKVHQLLHKQADAHEISPTLHNLFTYGLYQGCQATTTIQPNSSRLELYSLFTAQQQLGWAQFYYTCLVPQWAIMCNSYHPTVQGTSYYTASIVMIWTAVLKVWSIQNQHLYPPTII